MTAVSARTAPSAHRAVAPAFVALVLGAAAMGLSPVLVRISDIGPFALAFWRVALATPILWLWMRAEERGGGTDRRPQRFSWLTILSGLVFAGDLLVWHLAIRKTTVANATFFATMAPLWVVGFGWLFLGAKASRATLLGLGFCIVGGAALVVRSLGLAVGHGLGDGLGIVTGMFFGLYFLTVRAARDVAGAARVTFEMSLVAAAVLLAAALLFDVRWVPQSLDGWVVLVTLAWVSHAGGQGLLSVALGRLPAVFSSLVIFLEAIVAAILAWLLLAEPITALQGAGGALILFGIYLARPRGEPEASPAESTVSVAHG